MLLSAQENTADFITAPTEDEMSSAITKSMRNVMAVVGNSSVSSRVQINTTVGQSGSEVEAPVSPKI